MTIWCAAVETSKSNATSAEGLQSEKDAKEENDVMGRIVCVDSDDADRSFSASSPNATRNSGFAISRAVKL